MRILTSILTGSFCNPPANLLLKHLKQDTPVTLTSEPSNLYDKNAILVSLDCQQIPQSQHQTLAEAIPEFGWQLQDLLLEKTLPLGHIASPEGKPFQKAQKLYPGLSSNVDFLKNQNLWPSAKLSFQQDNLTTIYLTETS